MLFEDVHAHGASFAKDPCVVFFNERFYMYYTRPSRNAGKHNQFEIGIACSKDMESWEIIGSLAAIQVAEGNGICAPGGIILNGVLHLFYQSYGNFPYDYICHATSTNGIDFIRDNSNPIISPCGAWNNGRAIDADVVPFGDELLLYWATRDIVGKTQMLGVSAAPLNSDFCRTSWTQKCDEAILKPELDWEQECIEAPATLVRNGKVYMFYAGAYNCCPQQIGCAVSDDGIHFTRLSNHPLLEHGAEGTWNSCESGHPYVFSHQGQDYLFYQGSPDQGKTWRLSRAQVLWNEDDFPSILR